MIPTAQPYGYAIPSRSSDRAMPAPMAPVPRTVTRITSFCRYQAADDVESDQL